MSIKTIDMKANGAPEKIYICDFGSEQSYDWHTEHCFGSDIEYTRTDAFINKACEWFKNNWREYVNTDKDGVVCFGHWKKDFEDYMKRK